MSSLLKLAPVILQALGQQFHFRGCTLNSFDMIHVSRDADDLLLAASVGVAGGSSSALRRFGVELIHKEEELTPYRRICIVSDTPNAEISGIWTSVIQEVKLGEPHGSADEFFRTLATSLEIADLLDRDPRYLSGGESAKVVIFSHLLMRPTVIVFNGTLDQLDDRSLSALRAFLSDAEILSFSVETFSRHMAGPEMHIEGGEIVISAVQPHLAEDSLSNGARANMTVMRGGTSLGTPVLLVEDLTVGRLGKIVVSGFALKASQGEIIWLVGPNGIGKSTLLEAIAGIEKPDSGQVRFLGLSKLSGERNSVGVAYSPQNANEDITEIDIISELRFAWRRRTSESTGLDLRAWINEIGLGNYDLSQNLSSHARLRKFSSVLAAFARGSDLILLDEPTLLVTKSELVFIYNAILFHLRNAGVIICATHDFELIDYIMKSLKT